MEKDGNFGMERVGKEKGDTIREFQGMVNMSCLKSSAKPNSLITQSSLSQLMSVLSKSKTTTVSAIDDLLLVFLSSLKWSSMAILSREREEQNYI